MYLEVHRGNPQGRHIIRAVEILRAGGVIIYPTDTVYGIGCSIFNKNAKELGHPILSASVTDRSGAVMNNPALIKELFSVT